jgi:hypothetical protein
MIDSSPEFHTKSALSRRRGDLSSPLQAEKKYLDYEVSGLVQPARKMASGVLDLTKYHNRSYRLLNLMRNNQYLKDVIFVAKTPCICQMLIH